MRILQINTTDTRGGAAKIAYSLKKEFEKRGHWTSMFVGEKFSKDKNVFLLNNKKSFSGRFQRKLAFWLANDIEIFSSDKLLKTEEFKQADIVHCHNLHSYYFNLKTLIKISHYKPIVWTFHDMWPLTAHCAHSFDGGIKNGFFQCPSLDIFPPLAWHNEKHLEKIKSTVYKNSKFNIVTPSKWLAEKVGQSILKNKFLSIINNGIDVSVFKPHDRDECRQLLGLPLNKQIILIVAKRGQSNPWKGGNYAQWALEALKMNPGVFFVDLGGNTNLIRNNGKLVSFVQNQEILAKYYSAADILLYPSLADNCPLVVLEAMACGLPIVTFNTGGIPELIENKTNGHVAKYEDHNDLKTGIEYLLNLSSQEIEKMKEYSINKIRNKFTVEKMAEQYINLYEKIKTP